MHGADKDHILPGSRHRDVQPPLTSGPVKRSEIVIKLSALIPAVSGAENNRIPLIALHGLKVLDEEGLLTVTAEEILKGRIFSSPRRKHAIDHLLLGD